MLITIKAENLNKSFNKPVLKNLNFSINTGKAVAVTGPNGSGKSTLLEIIAGLKQPTKGALVFELNNQKTGVTNIQNYIGFSSLRVNPYGELSALENIEFTNNGNMTNTDFDQRAKELLTSFNLYNDRNKKVKFFSSGMKHRLRFILAILHDPHILILDEPGSNLDAAGKETMYSYIKSVKKNKLIIIATNEEEEANLCDDRLKL